MIVTVMCSSITSAATADTATTIDDSIFSSSILHKRLLLASIGWTRGRDIKIR